MRLHLCALLALPACYAPTVIGGAPCDPGADSCPRGQTCTATDNGYFCSGSSGSDAGMDDSPTDGGDFCLGDKMLGSVCLSRLPTTPITFAASATINTALTNLGNCTDLRAQVGGPSYCVIAGTTIDVASAATVRAIGPHAVVFFASQKISVAGTIDASSRYDETLDLKRVFGAAARTPAECNALGVDGSSSNNPNNGGGGAAGGSFGSAGGAGGNGRNGVPRGNPTPASTATVLVGGCPGGHGGDGAGGGGGGGGGFGGGAIYLIAGESITIAGRLAASGAGGYPGMAGLDSSGGGGGGGSGGMIVCEAPVITVTGTLIANGAGGGGGGGDMFDRPGQPGKDPVAPTTAAQGGSGGNGGGGNGGNGSTLAGAGANAGSGSNIACAGGGGGGGAGIIHLYGTASTSSMISPPPTN